MKIALVEDSPKLAELFQQGLAVNGDTLIVFENAQEAIDSILEARFRNRPLPADLLILDLDFGMGLDGTKLLGRLRHFIPATELPAIMIGGRALIEQHQPFQEVLDFRLLQKPIMPDKLHVEVETAVAAAVNATCAITAIRQNQEPLSISEE